MHQQEIRKKADEAAKKKKGDKASLSSRAGTTVSSNSITPDNKLFKKPESSAKKITSPIKLSGKDSGFVFLPIHDPKPGTSREAKAAMAREVRFCLYIQR